MLDPLHLDPHEQALYEILIDNPPQTEADLSAALRLADAQTHQVVESLEALGLISKVPGAPARYMAIAPDIALEVLFLAQEQQLKQARAYAEQLTARFQRTASRRDPAELVEVITGLPAIRQRWEQMHRSTKREFRGIDRPPYTVKKPTPIHAEAEMLGRGIKYRVIYDPAGLESFHSWNADVETSIRLGEEARVLANTPTKLVIVDDRLAMLPLQPAPAAIASMILVHPSGLLEALCALFEDLWKRALPLTSPEDSAAVAADQPTDDERRLLTLLATGMPDDAIAKHLGLSHRTFQRRLRVLLDRLGAETRFQAGLRAARRDWL